MSENEQEAKPKKAKSFFQRLLARFFDQDDDGDFDRDDVIAIAKRRLGDYIGHENAGKVIGMVYAQVVMVEATKPEPVVVDTAQRAVKAVGLNSWSGVPKFNQTVEVEPIFNPRDLVVKLIGAAIRRYFGVLIPIGVLNYVVEAVVDFVRRQREKSQTESIEPPEAIGKGVGGKSPYLPSISHRGQIPPDRAIIAAGYTPGEYVYASGDEWGVHRFEDQSFGEFILHHQIRG